MGAPATPVPYQLEATGIRKAFPGVIALDDVSLRVRSGTVHALVGENGAGKSTLMKVIAGICRPDAGEIRIKGRAAALNSPRDALAARIVMIHQELSLMPDMTVAENIWLGREAMMGFGPFVDHARMRRMTRELLDRLRVDLAPQARVRDLSVANRQLVEIARALSFDSDVLILDEPTSALTAHEVEHLFDIVLDLKSRGVGIVYITHKLDEVFRLADDVSVFRDGRHVATHLVSQIDPDTLIREMVGRALESLFPKEAATIGEVVLEARSLALEGGFERVSFQLRKGEILGIAGMVGAGRTALAEALFGVRPATAGEVFIHGRRCTLDSPRRAMEEGIAFLTEDRKESGCFAALSVLENMSMAVLGTGYVQHGCVRERSLLQDCAALGRALRIKTPTLGECIENLSGGNQQKALIARWLLTKPRILILDEPTRGVDVGAKAEIYRLVSKLACEGVAILMISSEMPEVLGMSDRVMVMREGSVAGVLQREEADPVRIMRLASG